MNHLCNIKDQLTIKAYISDHENERNGRDKELMAQKFLEFDI